MTYPTNEQQLKHLRAPCAPTEVNAHDWCELNGWVQVTDPKELEALASGELRQTHFGAYEGLAADARRALRAMKFYPWFAGLEWETYTYTTAVDCRIIVGANHIRMVVDHRAPFPFCEIVKYAVGDPDFRHNQTTRRIHISKKDKEAAKTYVARAVFDEAIDPIEKDN